MPQTTEKRREEGGAARIGGSQKLIQGSLSDGCGFQCREISIRKSKLYRSIKAMEKFSKFTEEWN